MSTDEGMGKPLALAVIRLDSACDRLKNIGLEHVATAMKSVLVLARDKEASNAAMFEVCIGLISEAELVVHCVDQFIKSGGQLPDPEAP